MGWQEAVRWWLPTALVAALALLALLAVVAQPPRRGRKFWVLAVIVCGGLSIAASLWQQAGTRAALAGEAARLRELGTRLDELGRQLPGGPGATAAETFDTVAAALRALVSKTHDLEEQIRVLQETARHRTVPPDTAARLADYLRPFGRQRVVVSCVPDDVEAYNYANRLAGILRDAGWDALGPEKTTIFGDAPAMGVRLFVRAGMAPPEAAKTLLDAFGRFNIPLQSGIAPSDAIPDPATVELFVSRKS
jgi:hypothetical protein